MAVVHGQKMVFKREGHVGRGICKNCGHDAYMTLCRHLNQGTLLKWDSSAHTALFLPPLPA